MSRITHMSRLGARLLTLAATLALAILTGCDVKNPGAILDVDLNDEKTFSALVTGMSGDFSSALDEIDFVQLRTSGELTGSGSYFLTGLARRGIINRDDINFHWGAAHRARWVAESGLQRMRDAMDDATFNSSPLVARAYLLAALSHRVLGENMCYGMIDAGPALDHLIHFDSAIARADEAIRIGTAAEEDDFVTAAHGIKAQAYVGLGDWSSAVSEAGGIPTSFEYVAYYSANSGREENIVFVETHNRAEMSVYGTYAGSFDPPDPRAPYLACDADPQPAECNSTQGADGVTPHWLQRKYPEYGANIPVVKGTEMRLIEAEARLEANDPSGAMAKINQVRQYYELTDLTAADITEAWVHLDHERHLTLWAEARRWHDQHRWDMANRDYMPSVRYIRGLTDEIYDKDPDIEKRATCFPISMDECLTNPNVMGTQYCEGNF